MRLVPLVVIAGCGRISFDPLVGPPGDATGDATGDAAVTCPAAYTQTAGGCYRFEINPGTQRTWPDAETACESEGGHLAVILDAAELAELAAIAPGALNDAWVGASDRVTPDVYLTVIGGPAFTPWAAGNPDPADGCMEIRASDLTAVFDNSCDGANDYVCEIDGIAADPTAF